jgi:hypothetical protein
LLGKFGDPDFTGHPNNPRLIRGGHWANRAIESVATLATRVNDTSARTRRSSRGTTGSARNLSPKLFLLAKIDDFAHTLALFALASTGGTGRLLSPPASCVFLFSGSTPSNRRWLRSRRI